MTIDTFKTIVRKDFIKNLSVLMTGTLIAQTITIAAAPVLTRLFSPENFGLLALLTSIIAVISRISSLCYERAIVMAPEPEDALNAAALSLAVLAVFCFLTFAIIIVCKNTIVGLAGNPELSAWIMLIPLGILIYGLNTIIHRWRLRNKAVRSIAMARTSESLISALIKIGTGFVIGVYSGGLIAGFFCGLLVSLMVLFFQPDHLNLINWRDSISLNRIKAVGAEYRVLPLFASGNALIMVLSQHFPVLLFSSLFSPAIVGFYSLGQRMLNQPVTVVGDSLNNLYFQKAAEELARGGDILRSYKRITLTLFLIGLLPFTILSIAAKPIFAIVFGQQWIAAGLYVQIMTPLFFVMIVRIPSNVVYEVFRKQNIKLVFSVLKLILTISGVLCGYSLFKEPVVVIGIFVWINIAVDIAVCMVAYRIVKSGRLKTGGKLSITL
jgi:lipopolysaccharide exporter